ncbi:unnamed protein product [Sphagnum jensenii]|uniref:Uncharacterized protein n=1 Tax=Sphagnum jensenii TaxID=128206 RepID=A0ABP1AH40_9BRYO
MVKSFEQLWIITTVYCQFPVPRVDRWIGYFIRIMRSPRHVMCSELWAYPRVQEPVRSAVPRPFPIHVVLVPLGMVPATAFPVRFAEVCWSLAAVIV